MRRQVHLGGKLEEDKEEENDAGAKSPEAGDELSYIEANNTKSQLVVGAAAFMAAVTGSLFYAKR